MRNLNLLAMRTGRFSNKGAMAIITAYTIGMATFFAEETWQLILLLVLFLLFMFLILR